MVDLDETLVALADPTRRSVIDLLREGPRRAGELADALDTSAPAMSKHLRLLRERGLVEEERWDADARVRLFRLRPEPFQELHSWLAEVRSFWSSQLRSFKVQAERRGKGERGRRRAR